MDPLSSKSPSSIDIHALFGSNSDSNEYEKTLRENGITTLEEFLRLTVSDLLVIGLTDTEAEELFEKAKYGLFCQYFILKKVVLFHYR
jgi:hypothetical protein